MEQHVARLNIEVQNAFSVEKGQPTRNVTKQLDDLIFTQKMDACTRTRYVRPCTVRSSTPLSEFLFKPLDPRRSRHPSVVSSC